MSDQAQLFDEAPRLLPHQGGVTNTAPGKLARREDPQTSHKAARHAAYRSGSRKAVLLEAYYAAYPYGMTDLQAATAAGFDPWQASKRCSDLRADHRIEKIGVTRAPSGEEVMVCRLVEVPA